MYGDHMEIWKKTHPRNQYQVYPIAENMDITRCTAVYHIIRPCGKLKYLINMWWSQVENDEHIICSWVHHMDEKCDDHKYTLCKLFSLQNDYIIRNDTTHDPRRYSTKLYHAKQHYRWWFGNMVIMWRTYDHSKTKISWILFMAITW